MQERRVKIFFEDEAPRLGCGWRWVTMQVGRKWVRFTDVHGRRVRLPINMLERLKPIDLK